MQVSVYLQNWSHVLSYVNKAESTPDFAEVIHFLYVFHLQLAAYIINSFDWIQVF